MTFLLVLTHSLDVKVADCQVLRASRAIFLLRFYCTVELGFCRTD